MPQNKNSPQDPTLHSIDWGRARKTPEVHVAVSLMMAANEFYTQQYLGGLLQRDSNCQDTLLLDLSQDAAWGQLQRYKAALVNEVAVTFIEKLNGKDNKARKAIIDNFHCRYPAVGEIYNRLVVLLKEPNARGLVTVRNHISFHFSYANDAQEITDGFEGKMDELMKDKHSLSLPLKQERKGPGAIRYVFAEGVTNKVWRTFWGIKTSFKSQEEADKDGRLTEMANYLNLAANTFLEWADAFIKAWADEYKLFTTVEKYSAVKARGERAVGPYSF